MTTMTFQEVADILNERLPHLQCKESESGLSIDNKKVGIILLWKQPRIRDGIMCYGIINYHDVKRWPRYLNKHSFDHLRKLIAEEIKEKMGESDNLDDVKLLPSNTA